MRKRANAHPENEGEDEEPVVKQEEEESSFNPEDDQSVRDATTKGKGKEREMTSEKEKGKEKRRRSDDHTDEDTTDGRNKRRCVDGSEGRSDSVRPELLSLVEAHEEEESMSVAAPGPGQEATVLEDGDQPLLNAEGREEEEEEEEEEDGQGPPASDDYRGEIFESNTEDVAQSGSDTLLAAEKLTGFNDNVEGEAQAMDIDVGLEYSSRYVIKHSLIRIDYVATLIPAFMIGPRLTRRLLPHPLGVSTRPIDSSTPKSFCELPPATSLRFLDWTLQC